MKKLLISLAVAGVLHTASVALADIDGQSTSAEGEWQQLADMFSQADLVADGYLDQGEFDEYHMTVFTAIDIDKDDILKKKECTTECFAAGLNAEAYRKHEFGVTPYRFDAIDGDSNGLVTRQEYTVFSRERFQYFDRDNDSKLTSGEFCTGHMASAPCDFKEYSPIKPVAGDN